MAIESLSILTSTGSGKAYLAEQYGKVIDNIQRGCISSLFKNMDLSGDPNSGSLIVRRFNNATVNNYGTARSGGGTKLQATNVVIPMDQNKELIEEVSDNDVRLFGVEGLIERRLKNIQDRAIKQLEKDFWEKAFATVFSTSNMTIEDAIDKAITDMESTKSNYIDGIDRNQINLIVKPNIYSKIQKYIDNIPNVLTGNNYKMFHDVRVFVSTDLSSKVNFGVIANGAVAQPVHYTPDEAGKFPASNDYHFGLFMDYGTKLIEPLMSRGYMWTEPTTEPATNNN